MNRQELVNFVQNSMCEHFGHIDNDMVEVLADCLEEAARRDAAPSCSVSYKVGDVTTTYTATSVPMLLEVRRALMEADRA